MILKIKRLVNGQDWWLIDGIRKINISSRFRKSLNERQDFGIHEIQLIDLEKKCDCDAANEEACPDCSYYVVCVLRMKDESECSVVFDTMAYLLNDDGKTIERISANDLPY